MLALLFVACEELAPELRMLLSEPRLGTHWLSPCCV